MFSNVPDRYRVLYEGDCRNLDRYAVTITSRRTFRTPEDFRYNLYMFLARIKFMSGIDAIMEYHNQKGNDDKIHAHGFIGNKYLPKNNKHNPFVFRIDDLHAKGVSLPYYMQWKDYCLELPYLHAFLRSLYKCRAQPGAGCIDAEAKRTQNGHYL